MLYLSEETTHLPQLCDFISEFILTPQGIIHLPICSANRILNTKVQSTWLQEYQIYALYDITVQTEPKVLICL